MNAFGNIDHTVYHSCSIDVVSIAGGKSDITDAMMSAIDLASSDNESPLFNQDIDELVNNKLINMFERDADGLPYLENYVIHSALRNASKRISKLRILSSDGKSYSTSAIDYIRHDVFIVENELQLLSKQTVERAKVGVFIPVEFTNADHERSTRYVETMHDITMHFTVAAMNDNDRWPAIWNAAESYRIGASRHHGYGQFFVTHWS